IVAGDHFALHLHEVRGRRQQAAVPAVVRGDRVVPEIVAQAQEQFLGNSRELNAGSEYPLVLPIKVVVSLGSSPVQPFTIDAEQETIIVTAVANSDANDVR